MTVAELKTELAKFEEDMEITILPSVTYDKMDEFESGLYYDVLLYDIKKVNGCAVNVDDHETDKVVIFARDYYEDANSVKEWRKIYRKRKMKVIKPYCGKVLIETNGIYTLVDLYSYEVMARGTLTECERVLDTYIKEVVDR